MRFLRERSHRYDPTRQVLSRLSVLDGYDAVTRADSIETAKRLERLRYGTVGSRAAG